MRRSLTAVSLSVAVTLVLLLTVEIIVRLAEVNPLEWPVSGGNLQFRGFAMDPLLGPVLRPGWSGQWLENFSVAADERGFRTTGFPPPAAPRARVAFLGDSCTFGWGIDTPQTFVAQLDAHQRNHGGALLDLMNAGYLGQSAVVGEHVLREQVLPHRPDVVVIGFSANNAFRLSSVRDAARFRFFQGRKLLLRSRLFHLVAAWLAHRSAKDVQPRNRDLVMRLPLSELSRVASAGEFEAATRAMIKDARAHGAAPLLLILPRASGVSAKFEHEDAGVIARRWPRSASPPTAVARTRELTLLEASCLDFEGLADPLRSLDVERDGWQPVYPSDASVRAALKEGARAFAEGRGDDATERFAAALALQPASPLALYDLGVAKLSRGDGEGLRNLDEAERLSCNVFLRYQAILWRIGHELRVPVVDVTLYFQAHDGEELYLDQAHPNVAGHRIIADALSPMITDVVAHGDRGQ